MSTYKIDLSRDAESNMNDTLDSLIEASRAISNSAEADFQQMKNTKWYKRIWQLVTLSKNNEKIMANGVSNVAKLQEIVMQALLLLSQKNVEMAEAIAGHEDLIVRLSSNQARIVRIQNALIRRIERFKTGIEDELRIDGLNVDEKILVISALVNVANTTDQTENSQKYIGTMIKKTGLPQANVSFDVLEEWNPERAMLLYRIIAEYILLATGSLDKVDDIELTEYLQLNSRRKKNIKSLVSNIFTFGGADAIIGYYDNEDFIINEDGVEFIQSNDFVETHAYSLNNVTNMEKIELVDEYVDSILQIAECETKTFKNKNVHIKSCINCAGNLIFENCIINYNEYEGDEITLEGAASLDIRNSVVICKGYDRKIFISSDIDWNSMTKNWNTQVSVHFEKVTFVDCTNFIHGAVNDFSMQMCLLKNCSQNFIYFNCVVKEAIIKQNIFLYERLINECVSKQFPLTCINLFSEGCDYLYIDPAESIFEDNIIIESENFSKIICDKFETNSGYLYFYYFDDIHASVKNCTFYNTSGSLTCKQTRYCRFENCKGGITGDSRYYNCVKKQTVEDCIFIDSTNVIKPDVLMNIKHCMFINCYDQVVNSNLVGGVKLEYCEFYNIRGKKRDCKDSIGGVDDKYGYDASIRFCRGDKKDGILNSMIKCVFDGIQMQRSFLVAADNALYHDGPIVSIEDCRFSNCSTHREDQKLIKEYEEYEKGIGFLKKTIRQQTIDIRGCVGLDNLNSDGSSNNEKIEKILKDRSIGDSIGNLTGWRSWFSMFGTSDKLLSDAGVSV